jgi:hypothetical protein
MSIFNSGIFWFFEGILLCLAIIGIKIWMEDRKVLMNWWKWILVAAWLLMLGFTVSFTGTCLGEKEVTAAFRGGILFSLITIVCGSGLWRLLNRGRRD